MDAENAIYVSWEFVWNMSTEYLTQVQGSHWKHLTKKKKKNLPVVS